MNCRYWRKNHDVYIYFTNEDKMLIKEWLCLPGSLVFALSVLSEFCSIRRVQLCLFKYCWGEVHKCCCVVCRWWSSTCQSATASSGRCWCRSTGVRSWRLLWRTPPPMPLRGKGRARPELKSIVSSPYSIIPSPWWYIYIFFFHLAFESNPV